MSSRLQILAPLSNKLIDFLVLFRELAELVTEFRGLTSSFDFDFSSQSLELIDISWAHLLFNSQKFQVELLLIRLLKKSYQEFGCLQYLRAKNAIQEPLVVGLALYQLPRCQSLHFLSRQRRDNCLRVGTKQEITEYNKIRIKTLDTPLHWKGVNGDHLALLLYIATQFGRDVLIDTRNNAGGSCIPA